MLGVGALELFNEPKDSAAVTLRDLTHDAKRLASFDVTQPPQAGVGGKDGGKDGGEDGGGVFAECAPGTVAGVRFCARSSVALPESHPEPRTGV